MNQTSHERRCVPGFRRGKWRAGREVGWGLIWKRGVCGDHKPAVARGSARDRKLPVQGAACLRGRVRSQLSASRVQSPPVGGWNGKSLLGAGEHWAYANVPGQAQGQWVIVI